MLCRIRDGEACLKKRFICLMSPCKFILSRKIHTRIHIFEFKYSNLKDYLEGTMHTLPYFVPSKWINCLINMAWIIASCEVELYAFLANDILKNLDSFSTKTCNKCSDCYKGLKISKRGIISLSVQYKNRNIWKESLADLYLTQRHFVVASNF